ncbi:MAG: hypothetical protein RIQ89_1832 [Bacteroidota bacterium]|jgi:tryptophan 2,3-dioxygenase
MELTNQVKDQLLKLQDKYQSMGQDMNSYLDGLLLSNYLTYWDYIKTDTLLTLQQPKTDFPDELIFITYHQITELYFKLCLHELDQIAHNGPIIESNGHLAGYHDQLSVDFFIERMQRVNRYFEALIKSFEIMVQGMDPNQFMRFRMALLPASGFQSAQYRMIEFYATDLVQLVDKDFRQQLNNATIDEMIQHIYWNKGATEADSGKKTLTLTQFEKKYIPQFTQMAHQLKDKNVWQQYLKFSHSERMNDSVIHVLKTFDNYVNVQWPLMHYKSAARYLNKKDHDVPATGGTNWQKYLPPRFQKRVFYPSLWTESELNAWGT